MSTQNILICGVISGDDDSARIEQSTAGVHCENDGLMGRAIIERRSRRRNSCRHWRERLLLHLADFLVGVVHSLVGGSDLATAASNCGSRATAFARDSKPRKNRLFSTWPAVTSARTSNGLISCSHNLMALNPCFFRSRSASCALLLPNSGQHPLFGWLHVPRCFRIAFGSRHSF